MIEYNLAQKIDYETQIHYKLIEHERCEDAPFVGALIAACDCKFNCPNCFNQHIKNLPIISKSCEEILNEIKSNVFNKGIIFAGLEWSLQITECTLLAKLAKEQGLQTMLYTGSEDKRFIGMCEITGVFDYIKYGSYKEELKTTDHIEHSVILASSNQHILKKGVDFGVKDNS